MKLGTLGKLIESGLADYQRVKAGLIPDPLNYAGNDRAIPEQRQQLLTNLNTALSDYKAFQESCSQPTPRRAPVATLTRTQATVVRLIALGWRNKQIAAILGNSIKTIEKHRQWAMDKLNLHSTAALTRFAIRTGLITVSAENTASPATSHLSEPNCSLPTPAPECLTRSNDSNSPAEQTPSNSSTN